MDINNKEQFLSVLINIIEESKKEAIKIFMTKYGRQCKNALELSIEQFYDDYSPGSYQRQEGLLTAFRINPDGTYDFDEGLISGYHRVSNDYLYDLAFRRGYHGGADKNNNGWYAYHPNPGVPYWKMPPDYTRWYKPAVKTTPILEMVDEKIALYDFDEKYKKILIDLIRGKLTKVLGGAE